MDTMSAKKTLGIRDVSEAKAAYRRLAKKYHPDVGGDPKKFRQITEAYKVCQSRRTAPFQKRPSSFLRSVQACKKYPGYANMLESKFQKKIRDSLEGAGAMVFNVHGSEMQEPGWPDLQVYHPKWTGHLELKVARRKMSERQRKKLRELQVRGTAAFCLRLDDQFYFEDWQHEVILARSCTFSGNDLISHLVDATRVHAAEVGTLWRIG